MIAVVSAHPAPGAVDARGSGVLTADNAAPVAA